MNLIESVSEDFPSYSYIQLVPAPSHPGIEIGGCLAFVADG